MKLKLREGSYFFQIGDSVYLRNVVLCKDFLFTGIAYDILDIISREDNIDEEDVVKEISAIYEVSPQIVQKDVHSFVLQLADNELLVENHESIKSRQSIANQITGISMSENRLFSASIELTYRCNERCIHCYVDEANTAHCPKFGGKASAGNNVTLHQPSELTTEECKSVLRQLKDSGCAKLLLTGGEVLLRDDFLQIADYACRLGLLTDVYTNGYLLTPEILDELVKMKINSLSFSLYGGTPEIHDMVTGVQGSFDKTLKSVMMTKCAGIDTYIKTSVLKQNAGDMENLLKLGKSLHIDVTPSYTVLDKHTGADNSECRISDTHELEKIMSLFTGYEPHLFKRGNRTLEDPICSIGKSSLHINPYGEINPCLAVPIPLGNVKEQKISDVWKNNEVLNRLRALRMKDVCASCADCRWIDQCGMCLGRCNLKSRSMSMPKDLCTQAEASFHNIMHMQKGAVNNEQQ